MDDILLTTTDGAVRTLTLNRPEARNALTVELMRSLRGALADADADPDVAVVVLTGTDPAFCAGLDLKQTLATGGFLEVVDDPTGNPWRTLRAMAKPVIGAVNGACMTGGLELALQCSFLIASDRARFADTHGKVGAHPGGGMTVLLPHLVGPQRAKQMSFTGQLIDASTAFAWGLVNVVVPHDELLGEAHRLAGLIAANDSRAVQAINTSYRELSEMTVGEALAEEERRCVSFRRKPEA
jgi:enoyl-CoA hydratase